MRGAAGGHRQGLCRQWSKERLFPQCVAPAQNPTKFFPRLFSKRRTVLRHSAAKPALPEPQCRGKNGRVKLFLCMSFFTIQSSAAEIVPGRSVVTTRYGIVAASQPLAAAAGVRILDAGGNAVDAAIAANAVMGVTEPTGNGVGGDLFVLYAEAKSGKVFALNASGWSPAGLTPEFLANQGLTEMPEKGIHAVTVPGVVAGWDALREKFGTLPMAQLLEPAIRTAEDGFPLMEVTARLWASAEETLRGIPEAAKTWLIENRAPRAGEVFKNPALAATLRRIAEHGRAGFYEGPVAEAILVESRGRNGTMSAEDLSEFRAEWVEPMSVEYRGWRVFETPPQSQGIAALMMLNLMQQFPLKDWGLHSPKAMHVMIEAKKLAYADMLAAVGDPHFSKVPVAEMLRPERAAARVKLINMEKAAATVEPDKLPGITDSKGSDTIYLCVADKDGNVVSLIQSNYMGFGGGVVPKGCGFMLHNRGALFTLRPGQPNTLAPRKRPLHTIIPGIMQKDGVTMGFGIMGGWNQAQAHAQFVSHIADHGLTMQQALEAGRFTKGTFTGLDVQIEATVPEATRKSLASLGHAVAEVAPRSSTFGFGQAVMTTPARVQSGASDPRHDGAAVPQVLAPNQSTGK
jgi:gamma-glutamyltranspeptidase/glutathione hydrolase